MDSKYLLELMLIFVLHFQGITGQLYLYSKPGQNVSLPCQSLSPSETICSDINWLYDRDQAPAVHEVLNGKVKKSSARAARLSVTTGCSLVINNITTEEFGRYTCRQGESTENDRSIILSVLKISQSPPDNSEVTLECSLLRFFTPCGQNSLRWLDDTGAELRGGGVGYRVLRQTDCVSRLIVKRQSDDNRRYTCQFVDGKDKIEADYTPDFTEDRSIITGVVVGAVVSVVVMLLVVAAVVIKYRKRGRVTEDVQKPTQHPEEPESNLTYVTVNHANKQASPYNKVREEVTYSAVKFSSEDRSRS